MRKVKCKYWENKKCNEGVGLFHQWGSSYEEFESGPGNYTIGIVELANGKVVVSDPKDIEFIDIIF